MHYRFKGFLIWRWLYVYYHCSKNENSDKFHFSFLPKKYNFNRISVQNKRRQFKKNINIYKLKGHDIHYNLIILPNDKKKGDKAKFGTQKTIKINI